jgi:pyruvate/2-oxoglutarate dehydrogenase complex dihydrolipoamide acyltransferase (E2) component
LPIVVAADHRLNDGADLAAFINEIAAYVSDPVRLATT